MNARGVGDEIKNKPCVVSAIAYFPHFFKRDRKNLPRIYENYDDKNKSH